MSDSKELKPSERDFDSDALIDSLLFEEPRQASLPTAQAIKLHEPLKREYSEDDVTMVGRTVDLLARLSTEATEDDGTSGLEELASSDINPLLSSLPAAAVEANVHASDPSAVPPLPEVPSAPRLPSVPRPAARLSTLPELNRSRTSKPPAVHPAGPPATFSQDLEDDVDERTRIYTGQSSRSLAAALLPDPFAVEPVPGSELRNQDQPLERAGWASRVALPAPAAPQARARGSATPPAAPHRPPP